MPKKKPGMTPEEQSLKFERAARELEAAGELNPTAASDRLDRLVKASKKRS